MDQAIAPDALRAFLHPGFAAGGTKLFPKITNTAKNPPKTTKEALVPKLVARDPNAIGYVSASVAEGKQGIKVIMTLE